MSKSSNSGNASNDDIAIMLREFRAGKEIDPISQSLYEKLIKNTDILVDNIKDTKNLTKAEMKSIKDFIITTLKDMGITVTNTLNTKMNLVITGLAKIAKDDKRSISLTDEVKNFSNLLSGAFIQSAKAEQRGTPKDALLKGISNEKAKEILQDLANRMGASRKADIDSATYKLTTFLGLRDKENEKKTKGYIDDLIDGLSKNKFIGGALRDTFRLVGLLGGQWLSQFGQLGKILGAGFYVAMEAFGPIFANLLIKGIGNLLGKAFTGLLGSTIGKAVGVGLLASLPFLIAGAVTIKASDTFADRTKKEADSDWALGHRGRGGLLRGASEGQRWGGRAAGAGLGALGIGAGLGFAGMTVGTSTVAGGALATVGSAIIAYVGAPLLVIGAAVGVIALLVKGAVALWKHFHKDTVDHNKMMEDEAKKGNSWWDKLLSILPWNHDKSESSTTPSVDNREGVSGAVKNWWDKNVNKQDTRVASTIGNLALNEAGGMIGIRNMDKMKASDAVRQYMSANPAQFNNAYELAGGKYAYLSSFTNDLALRDKSGKATEAVLYKGAGEELEFLWSSLVAGGMDRKKAEMLKYTSGRSTASSVHKKGGANSHDNIMNMVTDLGVANQWSDAEWKMAFETLKPLMADQGFDLKWEGVNRSGKTIYGDKFVGGLTNRHFHVARMKGKENHIPIDAQKNIDEYGKQQEIVAQQHSIEAGSLLQRQNPEELEKLNKSLEGKSYQDISKAYEKALKKENIEFDKGLGSQGEWIATGSTGKYVIQRDHSGNSDFANAELTLIRLSEYGGG